MKELEEINDIYDKKILRTCVICYSMVFAIELVISILKINETMVLIRIFLAVLAAFPAIQVVYYSNKIEKIRNALSFNKSNDLEYVLNIVHYIYQFDMDLCLSKLRHYIEMAKEKVELENVRCIFKSKSTVNNWSNNLAFISLAIATFIGIGSAIVTYNSTVVAVDSVIKDIGYITPECLHQRLYDSLGVTQNLLYCLEFTIVTFIALFYFCIQQQNREYIRLKSIIFILDEFKE